MIKAEIIADSLNPVGDRLTTFILEYPRFLHSEILTHRQFSKNASSSRAIPIEKMIQQVIDNPAMPVWWGKNQSGMQAKEELDDAVPYYDVADHHYGQHDHNGILYEGSKITNQRKVTRKEHAKYVWLQARDLAISQVKQLNKIGVHKQISNRILEPWFNIRVILSGTEFENFFRLRAHEDAQPEFQKLAYLMLEEYNGSIPKQLKSGEWHLPFDSKIDNERLREILPPPSMNYDNCESYNKAILDARRKICVARCARISYNNFEGKDDYEADIKLCDRLFGSIPRHLSPTEHVAMALDESKFIGNFKGFKQYRKFFEEENLKDERVKRYDSRTINS